MCINSCWVYLVLKSLTSLLYVVHVCRRSFTSPLMYYIICVMIHIMHVCRKANLASSSSWMSITYNTSWSMFIFNWYQDAFQLHILYWYQCFGFYPLFVLLFLTKRWKKNLFCVLPLCWWLTKRGRRIWFYMRNLVLYV